MIKLYESFKLYLENYKDKYEKYYKDKIDFDTFEKIVKVDPTSVGTKKGKYVDWLLDLVLTKRLKEEDFYKATEYLEIFDKYKNQLDVNNRDIVKIKNLPDLFTIIENIYGKIKLINQDNPTLEEYITNPYKFNYIINDTTKSGYTIFIPNDHKAARYLGIGTQWCTAYESDLNYKDYTKNNESLFVFINGDKVDNKYQMHIKSQQFMDYKDKKIDENTFYSIVDDELIEDLFFYDGVGTNLNSMEIDKDIHIEYELDMADTETMCSLIDLEYTEEISDITDDVRLYHL